MSPRIGYRRPPGHSRAWLRASPRILFKNRIRRKIDLVWVQGLVAFDSIGAFYRPIASMVMSTGILR